MTLLIFFIIILVFITVSISANMSLIIRTLIFLMILVIVPMVLVYSFYSSMRAYSEFLLILQLVLTCAMIAIAAIQPIRRIKNNDLTVLFRRD